MYVLIIVEYINKGVDLVVLVRNMLLVDTAKCEASSSSHHGMALRRKWLTTMAKTAKVSFYIVETTWD
jgi:hypothetical protein